MNLKGWTWYVARADELMLDLDARTGTGDGRARLARTRLRLRAAIDAGHLTVRELYIYRSGNPDHYHVIIRLPAAPDVEDGKIDTWRAAWEMQLYSDPYRGRCDLMREILGVPAPSLLIAPRLWPDFYRLPDDRCYCDRKHDFDSMGKCPAARRLRGNWAARDAYFGKLPGGYTVPELRAREGLNDLAEFTRLVPREGK